MNKLLIAVLLAFGGSVGILPQPAAAADIIVVRNEPPPLRSEPVPDARRGYVWAPGYWRWSGNHYVWVRGKWMRARHGYHWRPSSWESRGDRWQMQHGGWVRGDGDRDGDGIPNRVDRDRDNDGIPNRVDRDRDNDGVPNRYDARPNNPERR